MNSRDIHNDLVTKPRLFWTLTGVTIDDFDRVFAETRQALLPSRRPQALTPRNKLLLFMIWMRQYPSYSILSLIFGVNECYISDVIKDLLPLMCMISYRRYINWPNPLQWRTMTPLIGNSLGIIDGTPHYIQRPWRGNLQRLYYSGHRHSHVMSSQCVVDADNYVIRCRPGFIGSTTDSMAYRYVYFISVTLSGNVSDHKKLK